MAATSSKKLLVEGLSDQVFFEALCREIGYKNKEIWVGPPHSYGAGGNGKGNAITIFDDLLDSLNDERITNLGLIVDADYVQTDGLGFQKTFDRIASILSIRGYTIPLHSNKHELAGFIFQNNNTSTEVGVWIMPCNHDDGTIEDFCLSIADPSENPLIAEAKSAVNKLTVPKFPLHFKSKAEAATWLAWQKVPGQGLTGLIGNNLLDKQNPNYIGLANWLKKVFK